MTDAQRQVERQSLHGFALLLDAVAEDRIPDRDGDAEEVRADVRPCIRHVGMRGIRGEDDTGKKDIRLDAPVREIEVEIVDSAEGDDRELEAGVVMNAAEHEEARGVEAFLDDPLTVAALLQ